MLFQLRTFCPHPDPCCCIELCWLLPLRRFINGMKAQGTPLREARVVFYGAGSSAVGVATMIAQLLVKEEGLSYNEAKQVRFWLAI